MRHLSDPRVCFSCYETQKELAKAAEMRGGYVHTETDDVGLVSLSLSLFFAWLEKKSIFRERKLFSSSWKRLLFREHPTREKPLLLLAELVFIFRFLFWKGVRYLTVCCCQLLVLPLVLKCIRHFPFVNRFLFLCVFPIGRHWSKILKWNRLAKILHRAKLVMNLYRHLKTGRLQIMPAQQPKRNPFPLRRLHDPQW